MIREYTKGVAVEVSDEFSSEDFDCKCTRPECTKTLICDDMLAGVTQLGIIFPVLVINSGFRCPAHNKEVGGKPDSQHLLGMAADIATHFGTPRDVKEAAERIPVFAEGGIGIYPKFVHVDSRHGKARW